MTDDLLVVEGLSTRFPTKRGGTVPAVDDVSFRLPRGATLGVVGESGCGKSTLARSILRLVEPQAGRVLFEGADLLRLGRGALRRVRRDLQLVFQDPFASLDPRFTVGRTLAEPLVVHGTGAAGERRARVLELLAAVGLDGEAARRYPHEFSGGQRQRIAIARAIALQPRLVVADEPVSALDVSVQAQILNLLMDLRARLGLTYVFISHDLGVVRAISDLVAVMYLGRIVEQGPAGLVLRRPAHPYTRALLASVPHPDPRRRRVRAAVRGDPPDPEHPPSGCPFHPRCPLAFDRCARQRPDLLPRAPDHLAACHLDPDEVRDRWQA